MGQQIKLGNVLVVDDQLGTRESLKMIMKDTYSVFTASSAEEAIRSLKQYEVDLIFLDIKMPKESGIWLLKRITCYKDPAPPIVIMTAFPSSETAIAAFRNGAFDYIVKPFRSKDILAVAEKAHSRRTELSEKDRLVDNLRKAICENFFSTTEALLLAIDAKDSYTASHSKSVSKLFAFVAEKLNMHHSRIEVLQYCAFLHDIGKIGISDRILTKPGRLTEAEFSLIKLHPDVGYNILEPIDFLKNGLSVVRHHHERYDGKGYPEGLKGDEIPCEAAILSVIDAYDALTSDRPYRKKLPHDNALETIRKDTGTQFVPILTEKVISSIDEYFKIGRDETLT